MNPVAAPLVRVARSRARRVRGGPVRSLARSLVRPLGMLCALAGLLWVVDALLPGVAVLERHGDAWLAAHPLLGVPGFVGAGALLTAVGLPRQSVALVGGYLFGTVAGTLLALAATLAGCVVTWHVAAALGGERLRRRHPALAARLEGWTSERVFAKTLMLRLLPLGSNLAMNVAAGAARVARWPFFAASLVGFLPQTLVFALTGTSVGSSSAVPLLLGMVLLGVSLGIAAWLGRARDA